MHMSGGYGQGIATPPETAVNWLVLSRGERARKANWGQIKNLKCQTELFVGSKEVLKIFK